MIYAMINYHRQEDNNDHNFETRMRIKDEKDESFESDYDKSTYEQGPNYSYVIIVRKSYFLPAYE